MSKRCRTKTEVTMIENDLSDNFNLRMKTVDISRVKTSSQLNLPELR